MKPMKHSFLLGLLAPIVAAGSLHAATDFLLKIEGVDGEASPGHHQKSIEIHSWSWSASNPTSSSGSGGGAGKAVFSDMTFTASMSKASPQLLLAVTRTNRIPQATLFMRKSGTTNEYHEIKLENVLVTSFGQRGEASPTSDSVPTDRFALNFEKVTFKHVGVDGTNTTGTATSALVAIPPQ